MDRVVPSGACKLCEGEAILVKNSVYEVMRVVRGYGEGHSVRKEWGV